jgi:hypothetical protein
LYVGSVSAVPLTGYSFFTAFSWDVENEGRKPASQESKELRVELKGGTPVEVLFWRPDGTKF